MKHTSANLIDTQFITPSTDKQPIYLMDGTITKLLVQKKYLESEIFFPQTE
jgi:hypothetical protein